MIDDAKRKEEKKRSKTYFYFRHYQSFYSDPEKALILSGTTREEITKGQLMIYLYERMLNLSIKTEGILRFSSKIPFTPKILGRLFNLEEKLVEDAIVLFEEYGLVKIIHNKKRPNLDGTIFMCELPKLIASITAETKAKNESRACEDFANKTKVFFDDVEEEPVFDPNLEEINVDDDEPLEEAQKKTTDSKSKAKKKKEAKEAKAEVVEKSETDDAFDRAMKNLNF